MELGAMARDAVKNAPPAIEPPKRIPRKWRDLLGLYIVDHWGDVLRLEWKDGKLTLVDATDPGWTPTLAATKDPYVFVIEPGFRESGELVRFTRDEEGRVVSMNVAVATMRRLEPVSAD
jgi:hypothetical protein